MIVSKLCNEESGQGMVEYGLILVLVSVAALGALSILGQSTIKPLYEKIQGLFPSS